MTKTDLVKYVVGKRAVTPLDTLDAVIEGISSALASGDNVTLKGFGTFRVKESKARQGRNPKTGETLQIPAKKKVSFVPAKELKERVQ